MRVLEIAGGRPAAFAGMLLAELGHEVVRVVPPSAGSFAAEGAEPIDAAAAIYLHRAKTVATCDLRAPGGAEALAALLATSDALIEDLGAGVMESLGVGAAHLRASHSELTIIRVSPFGQFGSRASWAGSELVLQSMGGIVHSTGYENEAPLRLAGTPAHFIGGLHAATAALAARAGIETGTAAAPIVDISLEECYMQHWARHISQWAYSGHGMVREPRDNGRQGFPHTVMAADGWLYVLALNAEWEPFAVFMGLDQFVTHEWNDLRVRFERWDEISPFYNASIASRSRYDWFAAAAKMGYTFAPLHSIEDLPTAAQYQARGFLKPSETDGKRFLLPGLPFTWRPASEVLSPEQNGAQHA